jgi:hypothetical protein
MGEHERGVAEIVTGKLSADKVPERIASLILPAIQEDAPEGSAADMQAHNPKRVYLKSVSVEGFRGIGSKATLYLTPGLASRWSPAGTARASRVSPRRPSSR